ncbi:MAG: thioredoxin family protein [Bacteroidia bacterium]
MKNKKHLFGPLLFALFIILQSFTMKADSPFKFNEGSWGDVTKKATKEDKLIFVYVSMKGCHTCSDLEKSMKDQAVSEFYNNTFVNVHLDGTKTANNMRASKWGVAQVPALVFLDGKNKVIHKLEGYQSPEDMIAQAKLALEKKNETVKK